MFYVESSKILRAVFVELADRQPFNEAIECDDPEKFITECLNGGLIEACNGPPIIERRYKKPKLQALCKQFGLRHTGTKAELVERLRLGASEWYEAETENQKFWQLTVLGNGIAMRFAEEIGRESGEMEARLTALLLREDVRQAWETWNEWNAIQPWPITLDNQSPYETGYLPYTLDDFERVAGEAFMVLPAGEAATFLAGLLMDRYMLYEKSTLTQQHQKNHAAYLRSIRECPGVIGIRVNLSPHCNCAFAKVYAGDYRLEDAPLVPPSLCSNEPCCTCGTTAIFNHESETVGPWKKPIRRHPDAGQPIQRPAEPMTEAGIRRLAEVMNGMAGTAIGEADIQATIDSARERGELVDPSSGNTPVEEKPRGLWVWIKGLFG